MHDIDGFVLLVGVSIPVVQCNSNATLIDFRVGVVPLTIELRRYYLEDVDDDAKVLAKKEIHFTEIDALGW